MDDAEAEAKLEKVLKESIKRHHVSDVEVGGFLSGGIDSNYLATGLEKGKTFTVGLVEKTTGTARSAMQKN